MKKIFGFLDTDTGIFHEKGFYERNRYYKDSKPNKTSLLLSGIKKELEKEKRRNNAQVAKWKCEFYFPRWSNFNLTDYIHRGVAGYGISLVFLKVKKGWIFNKYNFQVSGETDKVSKFSVDILETIKELYEV